MQDVDIRVDAAGVDEPLAEGGSDIASCRVDQAGESAAGYPPVADEP